MANPTFTRATLNLACFDGKMLDPFRRKCLLVFLKACELKGIGGTDYTTKLTSGASGGLIGDTTTLIDEKTSLSDVGTRVIGSYEVSIAQASAIAAGGTTNVGIQTRMVSIQCLINVRESMLDRMLVFLECSLGVHKAYPQ